MKSYLTALDDVSFMRVQYGSKIIGKELPAFGGFYATKDNYYVVTGENNTDEDNTKEVYRITKYDKHWNKITSTGLTNCNTTKPFNAGSCRIDVSGNYIGSKGLNTIIKLINSSKSLKKLNFEISIFY